MRKDSTPKVGRVVAPGGQKPEMFGIRGSMMAAMKEVLAYDTVTEAEFAAGLLQVKGIPCEVRNEATSFTGGVGTLLPFPPQVWVLRDEDLPRAIDILKRHHRTRGASWKCLSCGNENEPAFDACWSCGAAHP